GPDSMMWRLSRHALAGAHGSGRALMLQIAHPWVTRGIDQHSETRADPLGRAARTFTAVLSIVYGSLDQAIREAVIVRDVHSKIVGNLEQASGVFTKGSEYRANEANAMLWVHATLWDTTVLMHELFIKPLTREEKEAFYEETRLFAYMFGIPDDILPPNWHEFIEYNQRMRDSDELFVTDATRELAGFLFKPLHLTLTPAMYWLRVVTAATLNERLREGFHLSYGTREQRLFNVGRKAIHLIDKVSPPIVRYGPTYIEAQRRLQGKSATWLTRRLTKAMLGREELVSNRS
ncbi:MAG: DUF2236 domain-containing protein, partial [Pseudomonadales bacterium]|nr:DUF2236 domain-containing protein [Pseudomonadales bacterium]